MTEIRPIQFEASKFEQAKDVKIERDTLSDGSIWHCDEDKPVKRAKAELKLSKKHGHNDDKDNDAGATILKPS